jgi:hypothetical protein
VINPQSPAGIKLLRENSNAVAEETAVVEVLCDIQADEHNKRHGSNRNSKLSSWTIHSNSSVVGMT